MVNREAGKPCLNLVSLLFQWTFSWTTTNKCNIVREKRGQTWQKVTNWLYFTVRWSKDSSTQRLNHVMVPIFTFDYNMPPADRFSICGLYFWWFRRDSSHATSKLDDSPQHRNISCYATQFNVQLERLIFCQAIRRNATPFMRTLCYSTLPWPISRNAALCVYSVPFDITLSHLTQRYTVCVQMLSYSQLS